MWRSLRILGLVGAVSCGTKTLEPLPLEIGVAASRTTAAPGESVDFLVTAQGDNLAGLNVAYGDNNADQFATGGARTARVTFHHAFGAAGTYEVRATVTDADANEKSATVQIHVP